MARKVRLKDYVEVKEGVKNPDNNKFDMGGWKGFITQIYEAEKPNENRIIEINWDIKTIENLPFEFVQELVREGCFIGEMNLSEDEVIVRPKPRKENQKKRNELLARLESRHQSHANHVQQEERISEILANGEEEEVSYKNLDTYRDFLLEELETPVMMTGVEDFPWEERFIFGYGSEEEYEKLKKTQPSYTDTFKLIEILDADTFEGDLMAKVRRIPDRRVFQIPLSRLEAIEGDSKNYELLNDFSVWVVNY